MIEKTAFIAISAAATGIAYAVAGAFAAYQNTTAQRTVAKQCNDMREGVSNMYETVGNLSHGMKPNAKKPIPNQ